MVSREFQELNFRRASRAEALATRHSASAAVLDFYCHLVRFQTRICPRIYRWESLPKFLNELLNLVNLIGPSQMQKAAGELREETFEKILEECWLQLDSSSLSTFFARVLLQPFATTLTFDRPPDHTNQCPRCKHYPQVAILRPKGHGSVLALVCSLCLLEWEYPRGQCPWCQNQSRDEIIYFSTPEFKYLQVQACESCQHYLHVVDLGKEPEAVADVDELVALPLDVWARMKGYEKVQLNLIGI